MKFSTMCALRVYLNRGDDYAGGGFFRRLFKQPLSAHLLQQALKHGVTHASVHLAHSGFTRGAKAVSVDISEVPVTALPVCLELVGPRPLLEQFVALQGKPLAGATLVMLEGVQIAPIGESVVDEAPAHVVEYIGADRLAMDGPALAAR